MAEQTKTYYNEADPIEPDINDNSALWESGELGNDAQYARVSPYSMEQLLERYQLDTAIKKS